MASLPSDFMSVHALQYSSSESLTENVDRNMAYLSLAFLQLLTTVFSFDAVSVMTSTHDEAKKCFTCSVFTFIDSRLLCTNPGTRYHRNRCFADVLSDLRSMFLSGCAEDWSDFPFREGVDDRILCHSDGHFGLCLCQTSTELCNKRYTNDTELRWMRSSGIMMNSISHADIVSSPRDLWILKTTKTIERKAHDAFKNLWIQILNNLGYESYSKITIIRFVSMKSDENHISAAPRAASDTHMKIMILEYTGRKFDQRRKSTFSALPHSKDFRALKVTGFTADYARNRVLQMRLDSYPETFPGAPMNESPRFEENNIVSNV
ncbi:hypothetical protein DICVIV_01807 [Dictyocaulus viviparus]|uniref:Uncharacterized protein n=1 Tax=Dictyocaulus viviparus TaxID=29172 RepID=A0A0D8YBQ1_DICVI|nr:hypothetical protein DICVIV_01807 [Dictyocaulus viviparus]